MTVKTLYTMEHAGQYIVQHYGYGAAYTLWERLMDRLITATPEADVVMFMSGRGENQDFDRSCDQFCNELDLTVANADFMVEEDDKVN